MDSKEVTKMSYRIAETCAELALYRIYINIDAILNHYDELGLAEIDTELCRFCERLQASEVLIKEANLAKKDVD